MYLLKKGVNQGDKDKYDFIRTNLASPDIKSIEDVLREFKDLKINVRITKFYKNELSFFKILDDGILATEAESDSLFFAETRNFYIKYLIIKEGSETAIETEHIRTGNYELWGFCR